MLVSDFMVNSMLKILKGISVECMECLNEDAKRKKGQILYIAGRDGQSNHYFLQITLKICGTMEKSQRYH